MKYCYLMLSLCSVFFWTKCTKEIQVDLNTTNPYYIVEAEVSDIVGESYVKLSKSINFSNSNYEYPRLSGASIKINEVVFQEDPNNLGTYKPSLSGFIGSEGTTYTLNIQLDGKTFTAISTMPKKINIDKIYFIKNNRDASNNDDPQKKASYIAFITLNESNNDQEYKLKFSQTIGDKIDPNIYIRKVIIGAKNLQPLFPPDTTNKIYLNSMFKLTTKHISTPVYDFFYTLEQVQNSQTTPSNPTGNVQGENVLGYFSAHSTSINEFQFTQDLIFGGN